jgi:hypothetical protein
LTVKGKTKHQNLPNYTFYNHGFKSVAIKLKNTQHWEPTFAT